jgi:hypothetical protein
MRSVSAVLLLLDVLNLFDGGVEHGKGAMREIWIWPASGKGVRRSHNFYSKTSGISFKSGMKTLYLCDPFPGCYRTFSDDLQNL